MTDWPVRGQKIPNYWDTQLKAYVDDGNPAVEGSVADAAVAAAIALLAKATDGSFGLAVPTGVGLEFVITDDALQDIRFNGTSL